MIKFQLLFLSFVLLDFAVKWQVRKSLELGVAKTLGPVGFQLRWVENTGVAFSLLNHLPSWVLSMLSLVLVAALFIWFRYSLKTYALLPNVGVLLIMAGGLNNCLDRLWDGSVTDYLEFTWFNYPIFNLSDVFVVSGCLLLALWLLFFSENQATSSSR